VSGNRLNVILSIPLAEPSKTWVYVRLLAGIAGSITAGGGWMSVSCCVLSGRGLCGVPIIHPEEFYR
jgi:hypothetical protein